MTNRVVVTRHPALIDYLVETAVIAAGTPVISHATPDDVHGRHVIGVLPLHLACLAASVTEVPLDIPPEARGRELTLDEIRLYARPAVEYVVHSRMGCTAVQRQIQSGIRAQMGPAKVAPDIVAYMAR
jgi:hypothetical protein